MTGVLRRQPAEVLALGSVLLVLGLAVVLIWTGHSGILVTAAFYSYLHTFGLL